MTLYEIIVKSAVSAIKTQNSDGSMPAGHNGPYHDPETPVRNTSHWLITFLKAYEISGEKKYREAAIKAVQYLCSKDARPMGATFWHRKNPKKNFCNGLIGQAWTIEALIEAGIKLEEQSYIDLAKEVFLLHPFDEDVGLWQRVAVDGMHLTYDQTFNHQLWFAAAGSLASKHFKEIHIPVNIFMDKLNKYIALHRSGLIQHELKHSFNIEQKLKKYVKYAFVLTKNNKNNYYKAVGYHQFNLYGLALLNQAFPKHSFWESRKFKKLWKYANSEQFFRALDNNKYGYPYNPPGFEMPFAIEIFDRNKTELQIKWLQEQFKRCFDFKKNLMVLNTFDENTHAARLYEATRLNNLEIKITSKE